MLNVVPALCYIIITTTLRHGSPAVCSPLAPWVRFPPCIVPLCALGANLYRCHQVPVPSGLRQVPRVGWKCSPGIYSPISVSWGPELPFSPSTQLLVRAPFWKPPHSLKLPVIVPVLVTSDMGVTLPTMFYLPLLSALTFAYTLVISPSLNSVSYFEYAVNFLDSEQYWTTISLF